MPNYRSHSETVLQFGTGRFLRAFVDLFCQEVHNAGGEAGRIAAVQSTGRQRAEQLNRQQGRFAVAIRGLQNGQLIDHTVRVESVSRALAADTDWPQVIELARSPSLRMVTSNVTEAGYLLAPSHAESADAPGSFPAKLAAVLYARWRADLSGLAILPCELLEGNADRLRALVLQQANAWRWPEAFHRWVEQRSTWCNTLVDRIVAAPRTEESAVDPLMAVAEPFALWLIEGTKDAPLGGWAAHPAVQATDTLAPYFLRKVRILNGAHTALVAKALPLGFATVREAVSAPHVGDWLRGLLLEEIVPVLEGRTDKAREFAEQVLERFRNPFLEHRLADIALAHAEKVRTRLLPTLSEFRLRFGRSPRRLEEVVGE